MNEVILNIIKYGNVGKSSLWTKRYAIVILYVVSTLMAFAQVKTEIDTTSIRIGEQINYKIFVETDSTNLVVFPEGQTFLPLEAVEATEIDTVVKVSGLSLSRVYKLTQFDSGRYTIPRQKILIGDKTVFTDSLQIRVNAIVVDTTKQNLYDLKPIIEVDKTGGNWWKWVIGVLIVASLVALALYWFIWREKPLTEEEEIALLPPYERAKLNLKKLDDQNYLEQADLKAYYSDLTLALRQFLDEKVYDRSLESTTDELVTRLQLLKDGNQFPFTKQTISNIETILKRADLVKFAKSVPDMALAEMDRATIDKEIDHIKDCLPEPTEEEKLLDKQYKEEQERKKKRKKIIYTVAISIGLILLTYVGFGFKYGFGYVNDTLTGNKSKSLLEGEWVESAYGFPPIWIETPEVLKRQDSTAFNAQGEDLKTVLFEYGELTDQLYIRTGTTQVVKSQAETADEQKSINLNTVIEGNLKSWEDAGVRNILTKTEQYITPNGAEGVKTFGTAQFPGEKEGQFEEGEYQILSFTTENVIQQIVLVRRLQDNYAEAIIARVVDSIELIPDEVAQENEE